MSGHTGQLIITHHADTLGRKALRRLSDPFVIRAMQRASRIIVTSRRYLDSSGELAPFRNKCRVIPIGIDMPTPTPYSSASVRDLRSRYGDRLILSVGRLVAYKGLDVLIRAMKYVDATLLLVGSGPLASPLDSLAQTMGLAGRVVMLQSVQDLGPLFAAVSVFVLPSVTRAESLGVVQLEAMAAGLPIINTNIDSGVPEVSRDGQTGLTVPPGDEHALARAITMLLDREDLRFRYGVAARNRVLSDFTADLMAERTMELYEEVQPSRQPVRRAA
jgi:rhamnosyl/mannosyltransferase